MENPNTLIYQPMDLFKNRTRKNTGREESCCVCVSSNREMVSVK